MRVPYYFLFLSIYTHEISGSSLPFPSLFRKSADRVEGSAEHLIPTQTCNEVFAVDPKFKNDDCHRLCLSSNQGDKSLFKMKCNFKSAKHQGQQRSSRERRQLSSHTTRKNNTHPRFHSIDSIPCNRFVARHNSYTNRGCFVACEKIKERQKNPFRNRLFSERCVYQHWTKEKDGEIKISDLCFSNIVYGYGDSAAVMKVGYASRYVETPAECMALCQHDRKCVNWLFEIDETVLDGSRRKSLCHFKNQQMIEEALNTKMVDPESTVDGNVCEVKMPSQCASGDRDCLKCCDDHSFTCAYRSPKHISGWKFCEPLDQCNPDFCHLKQQPLTTTTRSPLDTTTTSTLLTTKPSTCKCRKKCCCDDKTGSFHWVPRPNIVKGDGIVEPQEQASK